MGALANMHERGLVAAAVYLGAGKLRCPYFGATALKGGYMDRVMSGLQLRKRNQNESREVTRIFSYVFTNDCNQDKY